MRISDWSSDVCSSDLGGRVDLDEETGIDMGGCANVLKGSKPTGSGHIGVNSVIVEVEKWTGKPLRSDVETAHIIPLETGTPIQPAPGRCDRAQATGASRDRNSAGCG